MSEEAVMPFWEHMRELVGCLRRIVVALALGFFVCWGFHEELFAFLSAPVFEALANNGIYSLHTIEITESIVVYLKTSVVAGVVLTSPYVIYQLWAFVGPGLLKQERQFLFPLTFFTLLFFLIGTAFAYQVIIPFITDWLVQLTLNSGDFEVMITVQNTYSTSCRFLMVFGLVFELPLVIFFLSLFGAVTPGSLLRFFRYFVVLSFVISAILTPPDPISQLLMALPLNALYAFGILVSWMVARSEKKREKDPSGNVHVGATSLRLMGGALLLVAVAGALLISIVRNLPANELDALIPPSAQWVVGANPMVIAQSEPVAINDLREDSASFAQLLAPFTGDPDAEIPKEAMLFSDASGQQALLVRGKALSSHFDATAADAGYTEFGEALVIDEDTVAFGPTPLLAQIKAIRAGKQPPIQWDEANQTRLARLRRSGPLWVWIGAGHDESQGNLPPMIGNTEGVHLAWLSLPPSGPRLTLEFHGDDADVLRRVEAELAALRDGAIQRLPSGDHEALMNALTVLGNEVKKQTDDPGQKKVDAALSALRSEVSEAGGADGGRINPLVARTGNWHLRRETDFVRLDTTLNDQGLRWLWSALIAH